MQNLAQTEQEALTLASAVAQGTDHVANSSTAAVLLGRRRQPLIEPWLLMESGDWLNY